MPTRRALLTLPLLALPLPILATGCGAAPEASGPGGPGQSPIDLVSGDRPTGTVPELVFHYPDEVEVEVGYVHRDGDSGCGVRAREETVEAAVPEGAAWLQRGDERFDLVQFHFHTPSEHTVDGQAFPMEQHLVHRSAAGATLVVGLFLVGGGRDTPQDRVLTQFPQECGDDVQVEGVDLAAVLPDRLDSDHYTGSLTTSPYTGEVQWHVLTEPAAVEDITLERFAELFPDGDARGVQPLTGRVVDRVGGSRA